MLIKVLIGIGFVLPSFIAFLSTLLVLPKYDNKGIKHYFSCKESWIVILTMFNAFAFALTLMLCINKN